MEATQPEYALPREGDSEARDGLSVVSLFSGAGGFDHGFKQAGSQILLANELEEASAETLLQHFSDDVGQSETPVSPKPEDLPMVIQGDVMDLDLRGLSSLEPDVLIGGPPCQEFSVMNGQNRRGIRVEGGQLYRYFAGAIAALNPKAFVFENVHGLVSANKNKAYERIEEHFSDPKSFLKERGEGNLAGLAEGVPGNCEYTILHDGIVDAPDLGVPQTRRRLIMIGIRDDVVTSLGKFKRETHRDQLRHSLGGGDQLFHAYPLTCLEAFEGEVLLDLQDRYTEIMEAYRSLPNDLPGHDPAKSWVKKNLEESTGDILQDYLRVNQVTQGLFGEESLEQSMREHRAVLKELGYLEKPVDEINPNDGSGNVPKVSSSVEGRMRNTPPGENYKFTEGTKWEVTGSGLSLIYRRSHPLTPAPTVVAHGGGGTYGYHYDRSRNMLSLRERARLQTFSDEYLFSGGVSEMRKQIGDAVPPLMARRVAEALSEILSDA